MKSRFKRYMTFVLSLAMLVGMLPQAFVHAEEVAPDVSTNQKGQVAFTSSEGGQLRVWTDGGTEYMISEENNNVLLEYEVGEAVHTEVKENSGYEVATYTVTTDSGTEKDLLSEKSTDIVITEEMQNVAVVFNKKEVKSENIVDTKKDITAKNDVVKEESVSKKLPTQQNTVSNTVSSAMRATGGISPQAGEGTTPTVPSDPIITLNIYNLSGSLWKTFSYAVSAGSRFAIRNTLDSATEDDTVDLISAIEERDDGSVLLNLSDADANTLTGMLEEAEKQNLNFTYYNAGTTGKLTSDFPVSSSMSLDVKFTEDEYVLFTINYNNNNGIVQQEVRTGTAPSSLKPVNPTKAGAEFDDWYDSDTQQPFDWSKPLKVDTTVEAVYDMDSILEDVLEEDEEDIPKKITNVHIKLGQWKNMPKNTLGSHTKWKATITSVGGDSANKKWARLLGLEGKTFWVQCVSPGKSRNSYGTNNNVTLWITGAKISESGVITYKIRPTEAKGWVRNKGVSISNQGQKVYFEKVLRNTMLGKFKLKKESTMPKLVQENPNYSVAGAEFVIFKGKLNSGTDVSGRKNYGKLVTDVNGDTEASKALTPGSYTVVETKPSEGHSKFPEITDNCTVDSQGRRLYNNIVVKATVPNEEGEVEDDKIPVYDVKNSPQMDPLNLAIKKFNKESGLQVKAGNSHFDVEYKFSYYVTKNMTEAQCMATQPNRVWYMKPNPVDGKLIFDADHLVRSKSDPLYYNEKGIASVPIGTLTIEEVSDKGTGYMVENTIFKPVIGAIINGNFVMCHINEDINWRPELTVFHTTDNHNDIRRGDLKFVKVDSETMDRLANVPFKITSETTGESHTIVTDINGQASTEASWATRDDSVNFGQSYDDGVFFT